MELSYSDILEICRSPLVIVLAMVVAMYATYLVMRTFNNLANKDEVRKQFDHVEVSMLKKIDYDHQEALSTNIHKDLQKSNEMLAKLVDKHETMVNDHETRISVAESKLRAS